jgi:hypothetical protein
VDHLHDARIRLRWANRDAAEFHANCRWFEQTNAYAVEVARGDDNVWEATWRKLIDPVDESVKFDELAPLLGSFLDHGRAALNYSAYQLACHALAQDARLAGVLKPRSVDFPIFDDPDRYRRSNRLKQLPEAFAAPIEQLQPYHGSGSGLWLLHLLAATFRHNVIHVVVIDVLESIYSLKVDGKPQFPYVLEIMPHERVSDGDKLMRSKLDTDSTDVRPIVPIVIGIDHELCRERDAVGVLNQIARDVQAAIDTVDCLLHTTTATQANPRYLLPPRRVRCTKRQRRPDGRKGERLSEYRGAVRLV